THLREQVFLEHVGPLALKSAERAARRTIADGRSARKGLVEQARSEPFGRIELSTDVSSIAGPDLPEPNEPIPQDVPAHLPSSAAAATLVSPAMRFGSAGSAETAEMAGRKIVEKT